MKKTRLLALAGLLGGAWMQAQAATAEPLTADITTNATTVHAACDQLRYDQVLLAVSRATNSASGVATNLALVKADRTAVVTAEVTLGTSVQTYLQAAEDAVSTADTAYQAAFAQLRYDATNNPANVGADTAAVLSAYGTLKAALDQLEANRRALAGAGALGGCGGGGLGVGNGVIGHAGDAGPGVPGAQGGSGGHPGGPMRRR